MASVLGGRRQRLHTPTRRRRPRFDQRYRVQRQLALPLVLQLLQAQQLSLVLLHRSTQQLLLVTTSADPRLTCRSLTSSISNVAVSSISSSSYSSLT